MTEEEFEIVKQKSTDIYGEFMTKLTTENRVAVTRFIANSVEYIQKTYLRVCPFDVIESFRETYPHWYNELKDLFRQFPSAITNQKVHYTQIATKLILKDDEEPRDISFVVMMILKDKNAVAGGKIHYSHTDGLIMCVIPQNSVMLSTFVIAHEISHLVIELLGIELPEEEEGENTVYIATEMIADFFASLAYTRLLHSSSKSVSENLRQMMTVLTSNGDYSDRADCMIRDEQIKAIANRVSTLV